jgi:HD-like signal output (HDOD) protein
VRSASETASIFDVVNRVLEVPAIPKVLVRLNEVMAEPDATIDDVARVISLDPTVSNHLLDIVNSAYYGLQVRVSSVKVAVSVMGFNMTKRVALKAAIRSVFASGETAEVARFDRDGFWKHSIHAGVLARVIGQASTNFTGVHPEELYLGGLLHDIGKLVLLDNEPEAYAAVLETCVKGRRPLLKVEEERFGFNHADVSSVLATKWFLSDELAQAIRFHHTPDHDPFHKGLASLIAIADWLAAEAGHNAVNELPIEEPGAVLFDYAGVHRDAVAALCHKAAGEFDSIDMP